MDRGLQALHRTQLIDLSVPITEALAEPRPPKIHYVGHVEGAGELARVVTHLANQIPDLTTVSPAMKQEDFRDGLGLANEDLELDSHAGTHLDAPWHFGPMSGDVPAKTVDQIPLEWCLRPGVVLDLRHKKAGEIITPEDLAEALRRINYTLSPNDIVLLMTGADKHYEKGDYFNAHPGMGRESTLWLLDQGIKIIGIDSWGFDRAADAMLRDYFDGGDQAALLPAHLVGRDREYCHIEKMANLDKIPVPFGFWVSCFPIKIHRGSAGWIRAVAIVEGERS